jgi:hypothetical protein
MPPASLTVTWCYAPRHRPCNGRSQSSSWFQLVKFRLISFTFARMGPRFAARARCALAVPPRGDFPPALAR